MRGSRQIYINGSDSAGGATQIDDGTAPIVKKKDVFFAIYKPRDTMCTDQTGKFPHTSSRGYGYQMILHEIDGNSTWVKSMKDKTQ